MIGMEGRALSVPKIGTTQRSSLQVPSLNRFWDTGASIHSNIPTSSTTHGSI